jgi:UDP-glucose:(glucosyl)LPS alpha-1,2-glucosyltransferase
MNSSSRIAIILPLREHFRLTDAGAVALTVKDFYLASRYQHELVVFGGYFDHFPDINYHYIQSGFWGIFGQNLAYAKRCIHELATSQIKIVEVHNRVHLALRIKKALPHLQVTLYLHNDPHPMAGLVKVRERNHVLEQLDLVYCVSHYVQMRLLEGLEAKLLTRSRVIYNAIPLNYSTDYKNRQLWIVYAGRFVAQKGVLELAKALASLLPRFPDWKVVFLGAKGFGHQAGQSKYEQAVYAELAHVAGQIDFRGHVQHDEVMNVFNQASIAVIPSIDAEAFGRTTLEAMDSGCAVISSTVGGLKEVAGDAAVLMESVSPNALSDALSLLIRDHTLRHDCALKCRLYARSKFSLSEQSSNLDTSRLELFLM